jgi:uncharacterized membrane protein YqaE (UPF0057 family)
VADINLIFLKLTIEDKKGTLQASYKKYLNKHIPSDKRATILSSHSLAVNIVVAIALPFMGLLKDNRDIYTTHIILAIIMILMTYMSTRYMDKRLGVRQRKRGDKHDYSPMNIGYTIEPLKPYKIVISQVC